MAESYFQRRPTMDAVAEGTILWEPTDDFKNNTTLQAYIRWLEQRKGLRFDSYSRLWAWSVADIEAFWVSIWEFFDIQASQPYTEVLPERRMPGARWFAGAELNYAEHVF